MAFWTYILRCVDSSYYTGHTDNLEKRIAEHHSGAITSCYTYTRRPLELVFTQDFKTREEALASEQQIKGWSRKKKEALMRGDWAEISRLAKSATPVRPEPFDSVRPELVEGHESPLPVRPEPVEGHKSPLPVHPEPVEGENSTRLRQAQPERSGGGDE